MDRLDEYGRTEVMRRLAGERDWERTRANAHRDKVVNLSEQLRRARKQPGLAFVCGCLCGVFFLGTLVALVQAYEEGSVVYGADVDGELRPRNQRLFMSDVWIKKLDGDWQATNLVRCPDNLNVK